MDTRSTKRPAPKDQALDLLRGIWQGTHDSFRPSFTLDGKVCPIVQRGSRMPIVVEGPKEEPAKFIELREET